MTRRRHQSSFGAELRPVLLQALLDARIWTLRFEHSLKSGSEAQPMCSELTKSIDRLGEHLTGDPEVFWRQPATGVIKQKPE